MLCKNRRSTPNYLYGLHQCMIRYFMCLVRSLVGALLVVTVSIFHDVSLALIVSVKHQSHHAVRVRGIIRVRVPL